MPSTKSRKPWKRWTIIGVGVAATVVAMSTPALAATATGVCNKASNYSVVLVVAGNNGRTSPVVAPGHCWSFRPAASRFQMQVHVRAVIPNSRLQTGMGYSNIDPSRHNYFQTFGNFNSKRYTLTVN
jgi:hypothetical protein